MEEQKLENRHQEQVELIQNELFKWKQDPFSVPLTSKESHMMRPKTYKNRAPSLSTHALNRVLSIDSERRVAWIEPYVTQEQLVEAVLPYGLVPPVVAEFKKITWGGAVMGSSLESSSHRYGQLNDSVKSLELLLGDGTVKKVSSGELFWGISGSFGSLATLLSLEVPLIKAKKYVEVTSRLFGSVTEGVEHLRELCKQPDRPDYIEAVVYDRDDFRVLTGRMTDDEQEPLIALSKKSSPWYYQLVKKRSSPFRLTLKDYLFRYDRGAFWMGSYALWGSLLTRFLFEETPLMPEPLLKALCSQAPDKYTRVKYPNELFRFLTSGSMDSYNLYRWLHGKKEGWFKRNFIVQDFYLPEEKTALFIEETLELQKVRPLWICPCRATAEPQILSPHFQKGELLFDVGIYGSPYSSKSAPDHTLDLEKRVYELGGRKMFYSWNFLDEEFIWQHYDKNAYEKLRKLASSERVFPGFVEKILT